MGNGGQRCISAARPERSANRRVIRSRSRSRSLGAGRRNRSLRLATVDTSQKRRTLPTPHIPTKTNSKLDVRWINLRYFEQLWEIRIRALSPKVLTSILKMVCTKDCTKRWPKTAFRVHFWPNSANYKSSLKTKKPWNSLRKPGLL